MSNDLSLYSSAQDDFAGMRQRDNLMPRLILQQFSSVGVVADKFKAGDYVDPTADIAAIPYGKIGTIVPLLFWLEWIEWNPDRNAPKEKRVLARSNDPQSELAKRAERYEEVMTVQGKRFAVTEYFNFIVLCPSYSGNYDDLFVINFAKSSYRTGKSWLNKLKKAKLRVGDAIIQAPIWANEWEISSKRESKEGNNFCVSQIGSCKSVPVEHHPNLRSLSDAMKAQRAEIAARHSNQTDDEHADTAAVDPVKAAHADKTNAPF